MCNLRLTDCVLSNLNQFDLNTIQNGYIFTLFELMFELKRVQKLREYLQLSENQFAKKIGVAQSTYNRFEKGAASLTAEAVSAMVEVFNVNPYWLLLGRGGEEPEFVRENDNAGIITITKDEYIELQRKALEKQDDRISELEKEVKRFSNT
jgi:transcriptional regulator with XRE-family HTH domain